ncbi:MAG: long-chain fatty acid--CoA ligase [Sinimarinibacterium flocculans]|uniref:long-chain fatty acid--CoA ligase n=1 Tax=Sinimarinibacterium flocculans TaxID=985250 RepID=UPI003C64019B
MRSTMMTAPLTLDRILERARIFHDVQIVSRRPDRSLLRTTYGDLYRRARQLAQALTAAGLKPGDRVATLMWNHATHLESYFGVPIAGGVLHTLNLRLHAEDIAYIAQHAGDRFLIVDDCLLPLYAKFRDQVRFERVIVVRFDGGIDHNHEDYDAFIGAHDGDFAYPALDENAAAGMCYTSGTTGRPKGVVYSHRSNVLHALAEALPDAMGLSMRDVLLPVVPMFHANAWGLPYVATMVGCVQVFPGPHLDAQSLLELMSETGTTLAGGVPTIWMGVLQLLRDHPGRWPLADGLRLMVGGSAPPPALIQGLADHGIQLHPAWGLTETSPLASFNRLRPELDARPPAERLRYGAKAGIPLPLVDLRLVNEDGIARWDGESVGEIEVRGPWVTASYHERPDAADRFSDDGWFRTGDVAAVTPEGYITITDRAKDLIKSGGEWISSVDLENELMAHPAVAEAAVIAVHHDKWMERPLAVVVTRAGAQVTAEQLRAHLKGKVADWWLPDGYEFIEQIPRTSTGKFQKLRLREMFAQWRAPEGHGAAPSTTTD